MLQNALVHSPPREHTEKFGKLIYFYYLLLVIYGAL